MKKKVMSHLRHDMRDEKEGLKRDVKLMKALKHEKHEKSESKKHEKAEHKKKHVKKVHHKKKHHAKKVHHKKKHHSKESSAFKGKVKKVMHEFKAGKLHSGSKKGPKVMNPKQAIAISLSEARRKVGE